ncbi:response regulator [Virgibacillus dakarensis]|nr:response regulator [Virgibacillus dakarensis]
MISIIIAEDDFRIANIHEDFLEKVEGVQVVGKAINGEETLRLVRENDVDLLLLDIYLPDYLGTDLIKEIRKVKPLLDIIIITAATEKHLLETSLHVGVVNYLIKPVSMERFTEVMDTYKQRKRLLQKKDSIDQDLLESLFHTTSDSKTKVVTLPKGIDRITLDKVKKYMGQDKEKAWTADEMGKQIGSSRTTARRYLEYLVSINNATVEQEYGIIGRPERKYYYNT